MKELMVNSFMRKLYKPSSKDAAYDISGLSLKDAAYEIVLYLDYWFMRRRAFNVFLYIRLWKIKRSLVGSISGGFVLCKNFTNHVPTMLYIKYQSIWNASS